MEKQNIQLTDIPRILFGEVPGAFYIEAVFRTAVIYFVLMVSVHIMGKRMTSQIGQNEMAAMVSLAAAIGVPLMDPARGILPIFVIALVVIAFQSTIASRAAQDQRFERISQGRVDLLVDDSVINLESLRNSRLSKKQLFAQLRNFTITHLGMVARFYLEANGTFSLKRRDDPQPGLSVIPDWDTDFFSTTEIETDVLACSRCGFVVPKRDDIPHCPNCGSDEWSMAVK